MLNNVVVMGRLVKDPLVYSKTEGGEEHMWARYTIAINRDYKAEGKQNADFISCFALGSKAKFAAKYLFKGTKIIIQGKIQSGKYTDEEGRDIFTTGIYVQQHYFPEKEKQNNLDPERDLNHQEDMGYQEEFQTYMQEGDAYETLPS